MVFLTQGCDNTELYLRIVGREERIVRIARDKSLAYLAPLRGSDRDILQVRLVTAEPTSSCYRLHKGGMDTPCMRIHLTRKRLYIGALELL